MIWLPFQECTGCTESITRAHGATIEQLIFEAISLDYQHTLMAAAGEQSDHALHEAMSRTTASICSRSTARFRSAIPATRHERRQQVDMLKEVAEGAMAIVAIGSCAAFGGIPKANPNPTGACRSRTSSRTSRSSTSRAARRSRRHHRRARANPDLRPRGFGARSSGPAESLLWSEHSRSLLSPALLRTRPVRRELRRRRREDRAGACTSSAARVRSRTTPAPRSKWNNGTSFPIEAGHGCIGCAEPDFWDQGGFYDALSVIAGARPRTLRSQRAPALRSASRPVRWRASARAMEAARGEKS